MYELSQANKEIDNKKASLQKEIDGYKVKIEKAEDKLIVSPCFNPYLTILTMLGLSLNKR